VHPPSSFTDVIPVDETTDCVEPTGADTEHAGANHFFTADTTMRT
jgi:hypothetical protein